MSKTYCFFDSETRSAGTEYNMPPEEFVRLFQYAINDGPVELLEVHSETDFAVWELRNTERRCYRCTRRLRQDRPPTFD